MKYQHTLPNNSSSNANSANKPPLIELGRLDATRPRRTRRDFRREQPNSLRVSQRSRHVKKGNGTVCEFRRALRQIDALKILATNHLAGNPKCLWDCPGITSGFLHPNASAKDCGISGAIPRSHILKLRYFLAPEVRHNPCRGQLGPGKAKPIQ